MTIAEIIQLAAETGAKTALAELENLSDDALRKIIGDITTRAAKEIERELTDFRDTETAKLQDRRLHNTRLLLKHYRQLKAHFQNAVYELPAYDADEFGPGEIWEFMNKGYASEQVYVDSIRRSATRTGIMLQHLGRMLRIYEASCTLDSEKRRYRILHARYLAETPLSIDAIAEMENIHRRTAERDLSTAIEDVTALIFGWSGIRDASKQKTRCAVGQSER